MKTIDTAIVVDVFAGWGRTAEEEIKEIVGQLGEWLGCEINLVYSGNNVYKVESADLFILDYGGVGYGCEGLRTEAVRAALNWAEDHPGSLLLLWTDHTKREYEWEFKEEFGHLNNVDYRYDTDTIFDELIQRTKKWLGLDYLPPAG